ncbi:MAG: helix-turn-helix transcriptional regulator [Bacteroidia bacterium]|jgi:transcriptional regulator with XRE-family HTH domain
MDNQNITANILSDNDFLLDDFNPGVILKNIAGRMKRNRLELNLSQNALAKKSGISLGSLKRFEQTGEISLKSMVMLALALDATHEFTQLFAGSQYQSINELLSKDKAKNAKRGRRNV